MNERILNLASAVALMLMIGCQPTTTTTPPVQTAAPRVAVAPLPVGRTPTADEAVGDDPCASRLHDIMGMLLSYYIDNNRLPERLDQLKPDFGMELSLSCPVTGKPYVYSPSGMFAPGKSKRIIVWDSVPHGGIRWCIAMPHMAPNKAIVPEVVPIPEKEFQAYVPAIQ